MARRTRGPRRWVRPWTLTFDVVTLPTAALAGLSGALYAYYFGFVEVQYFNAFLSIFVLLYVLIGGTQTAWGPLIGAAFFTLAPEALRISEDWRFLIFGVLIVAMMIVRPQGIVTRDALDRIRDEVEQRYEVRPELRDV